MFALFGALGAAAFVVTASTYVLAMAWLSPELERSRLAERAESEANGAMLDQETGVRGYLVTLDPGFLEPYRRGEATLRRANDALAANAGTVPELAERMLVTRLAEEAWRARWATTAADRGPGPLRPPMSEGKLLFDAYRGEERELADALFRRTEAVSRRGQILVTVRVVMDLMAFAAILLLSIRQHKALHESVVAPVAALLRHIGRVRDGELKATVDPAGPRELRELGEGLNKMVKELADARALAQSRDDAVRGHSLQLRRILDASREFSESLNLKYVMHSVRESTMAVGGYELVIVWLMDREDKQLFNAERPVSAQPSNATVQTGGELAGRAAKSGRVTFEGSAGQVRFSDSNLGPTRAIAVPLIVGARVVGVLEARYPDARVVTTQAIEVLEMLATHAATAIESARLHEVTEERSQTDPLTKLYNRRRLDEDMKAECKRSVRYGRPLGFVMLDVDRFKAFNDTHGHPQADVALQAVAEVIAGCMRATDTAYRYGGEEFCVLLRETSASEGMIFAERVRHRIEQRFDAGPAAGITASFGVSEFSAETPMPSALVEAADAAMYESKHAGRNRVTLSSMPPRTPAVHTAET